MTCDKSDDAGTRTVGLGAGRTRKVGPIGCATGVLLALIAGMGAARADTITGATLAGMCGKYEPRASYYILGAVDAFGVRVGQPKRFCIPKGSAIPSTHLTNIVCGFVSKHPDQQGLEAATLVYRALRDAFPCGRRR